MLRSGNSSQSSSITFHSQQSLRLKFSVSMEVFLQASIHWIRSDNLIECRKSLMRVQSAIYFGLTQMTGAAGVSAQEVQATLSARTFQNNSIIQTAWLESHVLTNLWWMATTGHMKETLWLSFQHQITAIDVETKPPLWKLMNLWNSACKSTR